MNIDKKFVSVLLIIWITFSQCSELSNQDQASRKLNEIDQGLIYYSEKDSEIIGFGGIFFLDLVTQETHSLTQGDVVPQSSSFSWSPAGKKLVYTGRTSDIFDDNSSELYLLDLDGNEVQLTNNNTTDHNGDWSPNGQTIAFWSNRPENNWLYLMNADGSDVRPIFDSDYGSILGFSSTWSPDGTRLAVSAIHSYTHSIDANDLQEDLQIVQVEPKKLFPPLPADRIRNYFGWSKDSKKLVYLSGRIRLNTFENIYTKMYALDIQTQIEVLITEFAVIGTPHWSPTEDVIAFTATEGLNNDELNVYLINGDGTGLKQLTKGGFFRVTSWSPDGKNLALEFIGEQFDEYEIYTLNIKSGALKQVTNNDVFDGSPIWVEF